MPLFDYRCSKGHYFEKFLLLKDYVDVLPCEHPRCKQTAHRIFISQRQAKAQRFNPVVIHRDAAGNIRFPSHENAPVPKGYERVELRTIQEVRRLEKHVNRIEQEKFEHRKLHEDQTIGEFRRAERADLRQRMNTMSPLGRDFARLAMEHNDSRSRERFDPEFRVVVFSDDRPSREEYRDQATGWKRGRD